MSPRIVVLGGGIAGLGAAWRTAMAGMETDVLELKPYVGGMAHTHRTDDGYLFDFGPHRFHTHNPAILESVRGLLGDELIDRDRITHIYFMQQYFEYPLSASNMLRYLPKKLAVACFLDFLVTSTRNRIHPKPDDSFETWVVNRFGRRLYDIYFGPYTAKVWGRDPSKLSASWAAQRVAVVDLWDLLLRMLKLRREDNGFDHSEFKDLFYYPLSGVGRISERVAEEIEGHGGRVHTEARVTQVLHDGSKVTGVIYEKDGETHEIPCDYLISTLPLPLLLRFLTPAVPDDVQATARSLQYRAMIFVMLKLDKPKVSDDHWIYFPDDNIIFNRVSEMKNFSPVAAPEGKTSLTLEITCDIGDEVWTMPEDELYRRAVDGVVASGLATREQILGHYFERLPHAYPSYDLEFEAKLGRLAYHLANFNNIVVAGRQAQFRYVNTDQALEMGMTAADEVAAKEKQAAAAPLGSWVDRVASEQVYFG
jgi:protoporphyrinogen oxidase